MERYKGDGFARSVSLCIPTVMITSNDLGHNSRSSRKHDWEVLVQTVKVCQYSNN